MSKPTSDQQLLANAVEALMNVMTVMHTPPTTHPEIVSEDQEIVLDAVDRLTDAIDAYVKTRLC